MRLSSKTNAMRELWGMSSTVERLMRSLETTLENIDFDYVKKWRCFNMTVRGMYASYRVKQIPYKPFLKGSGVQGYLGDRTPTNYAYSLNAYNECQDLSAQTF